MTWAVDASGTQAAVIGTEHTLDTSNANGTFQLLVDVSALQLGDVLELRVYTKVLATSGLNQVWKATIAQPQFNQVAPSPPLPSDQQIRFTLKQVAGVGRNYDWKVMKV
jgi:hypothetical protein